MSGQWTVDSCGIPYGDELENVIIGFTQLTDKLLFEKLLSLRDQCA